MSIQQLHPRRSPPRESLALPGNKRQKLSHSPEDGKEVSPTSRTSLKPQGSQESSSDQSASKWFNSVNHHVAESKRLTAGYDDEPPYFMAGQSQYRPRTVNASEGSTRIFGAQSRLDSENEELRGVIDDLTIENKKLKYILRSHRSNTRASPTTESQQDRLFEVRMHGLPPEKRRELEFLLKNFATSVHTSERHMSRSTTGSGVSSASLTGNKQITDSGYASNSNSGQTTSGNSRNLVQVSKTSKNKNIKSYLHDIPDTLLPRQHPIVMSERARMNLVVRRLEQLFTGKSAAPGEHSQPLQQQEVSQMAARADAVNSKKRKAEGTREAHILPPDSKVNFDAMETVVEKGSGLIPKPTSVSDSSTSDGPTPVSRPGSPDQRPTRPLDLDIHRAQVAAENIEYIRHLGLSSPRVYSTAEGDRDHPWMFLNLLISMAQLHTINVTPDFVRRAIKKISTKFELSKDGHKVRWVGGPEGTVLSKEEEKALETVDDTNSTHESTEDSGTGSSSKRSKTDSTSNAVVSNTTSSEDKTSALQTSTASKQQISTDATSHQQSSGRGKAVSQPLTAFDYRPIVYQGAARDPEEQFLLDSESSSGGTSRESSSLVHALSKSNLNQQRNADEGLITFYNNPYFCSDYSGENVPCNMLQDRRIEATEILGISTLIEMGESPLRYGDACYFTPQFGPQPFDPSAKVTVPQMQTVPITQSGEEETRPAEFECSGLGGTNPDDNFAVDVQIVRCEAGAASNTVQAKVPFTEHLIKAKYHYKVQSSHKLDLLPSRLPPASYIFFTSSSSGGNAEVDDSDSDSDESSSSESDDESPASKMLYRWSTDSSGHVADQDDDRDDSSMDMLAIARAADPDRVAEEERQYMITQPGGRAVAGSLAATVGASRSSAPPSDAHSLQAVGSDMDVEDDGNEDEDDDDDNSDDL